MRSGLVMEREVPAEGVETESDLSSDIAMLEHDARFHFNFAMFGDWVSLGIARKEWRWASLPTLRDTPFPSHSILSLLLL